jgi:hypothetical protein
MKIVKPPPTWAGKQVTCPCGAVLEIEFTDLRRERMPGDQRDQVPDWDKVSVTCPASNHEIRINDVPEWLISRIPTTGR